jgi:hypothetical protein
MAKHATVDPNVNGSSTRIETIDRMCRPRSLTIMEEGIESALDVFRLSMALTHDVLNGDITPHVCSSAAQSIRCGLRAIDLQIRSGNKPLLNETRN